jgi:N-acetylneuraminate synthase
VVTAAPVRAGTALTRELLAFKKPGDGIPARDYRKLVGRRAKRDLPGDHKLAPGDLE